MPLFEKHWQFSAVVAEEAMLATAIVQLGYLGYGFAYAIARGQKDALRREAFNPFGLGVEVAAGAAHGRSRLWTPCGGCTFDADAGRLTVDWLGLHADVSIAPGAPWEAGWTIPGGGAHHTTKRMGGAARGRLSFAGRRFELEGHALLDHSCGQPARETAWRWAAGVGRAGERLIAWNLRTGFDDASQAENAVWVDGVPTSPGPGRIEPGETWEVSAGPLALRFHPEGEKREDVDAWLVASRYRQPWGRFEGHWEGVPLLGYGVTEEHWARW